MMVKAENGETVQVYCKDLLMIAHVKLHFKPAFSHGEDLMLSVKVLNVLVEVYTRRDCDRSCGLVRSIAIGGSCGCGARNFGVYRLTKGQY